MTQFAQLAINTKKATSIPTLWDQSDLWPRLSGHVWHKVARSVFREFEAIFSPSMIRMARDTGADRAWCPVGNAVGGARGEGKEPAPRGELIREINATPHAARQIPMAALMSEVRFNPFCLATAARSISGRHSSISDDLMESDMAGYTGLCLEDPKAGAATAVVVPLRKKRCGPKSIDRDRASGAVSEAMTSYYVDLNLRALALAEERGAWAVVAHYHECDLFKEVRVSASPEQLAGLEASASCLAAALLHEAVHGKDSLLDMEHWFNKKYLVPRPPAPDPNYSPAENAILAALAAFDAAMRSNSKSSSITPSGPATTNRSSVPSLEIL